LTSISFADAQRGAGFPAHSRSDDSRIYRRAQRHSRFVRWSRAALLFAIFLVVVGLVVENYLPVGGLKLPAEVAKVVIRGNTVIMQEPRLRGFTTDSRAYEFTANSAQQDITKPDFVELQQIHAKMAMADKSTVRLSADAGVYNMKTDMLTLRDNIHLTSTTGYEARLSEAVIDMNKGNVVSDTPVWVKLLDGDLNAKRLEIIDKGDVLRFTDVTMVLQSGKQETKAAQQ
jgi:lipopolysaccharide export system protein LptC